MKPQLNGKGKPQLNPHRRPDEEEFEDENGRTYLGASPLLHASNPDNQLELDRQLRKKPGVSGRSKQRRALTQKALALFTAGHSMNEIAAELGVTTPTVTQWFVQHRRLVAEGSIDQMLDETAVPLAAENLVHGLLAGDKDYTIETLKGRGKLKRHSEGEGKLAVELPALVVRFETPELMRDANGQEVRVHSAAGSIHGTAAQPKQITDGQVIDADVVEREIVGASS